MKRILVGDIGGTKTRLALAEGEGTVVVLTEVRTYPSLHYATLELVLEEYVTQVGFPVEGIALGVAGPVSRQRAQVTNLPWVVESAALRQRFGVQCILLNDLEAVAWGLPALRGDELFSLQEGVPSEGNRAVIAAGTGLGEAGIHWDGTRFHPFATEGGHASFAPRTEREMALWRFLQARHGHVSWERVVSGMALPELHEFLRAHEHSSIPAWLQAALEGASAGAVLAQAALEATDPLCVELMHWFVRLYGAEAGNLALKVMSRGGVYVGGGIAPKILPLLRQPGFLESFVDKGRMRPLLEAMPVQVILTDQVALYGLALAARSSRIC
ncbi:MAG: glucokinase [Ferrovum myxofaciens]|uniref:glucokinase n=1 Tax=Ferrovum myxofaciens TaxID=416213 RepID=UPI0023560CC8|nr:glucokinase [Ferrovum myxofaciens]QKE40925.1 MAG: glucokinase [Ferrovum myxofaciens]